MPKEFDEILYDRRVVARNIKNGVIAQKDFERFLKSLSDDGGNAVDVVTSLGSSGHTPRTAEADEE